MKHEVGQQFFDEVVFQAQGRKLLSDEHFTVDGTLIEACASLKSFKRRDQAPSDEPPDDPATRPSTSMARSGRTRRIRARPIPTARLLKKGKGKEAKLSFMGHALMENRHGLLVDFQMTEATGTAERDVTPTLLRQARDRGFHPKTLGGDKNYDTRDCVADIRDCGVTPHVAQNTSGRRSAIDGRTTRHPLQGQPADPEAGRGDLRLDEDGRRLPPDPLPGP
ncbi:MAG: transposase [Chloroflexota bacterium]